MDRLPGVYLYIFGVEILLLFVALFFWLQYRNDLPRAIVKLFFLLLIPTALFAFMHGMYIEDQQKAESNIKVK